MSLLIVREDRAQARRLQRRAKRGQLRRIYPGIYTDDQQQPLESIVRRELFALSSLIAPGSIISHRSALEVQRPTAAGNVFLTGPHRRDFELPGITLRMAQGGGPLDSDVRIPTVGGHAFISDHARALLENLTTSRGDPAERRTLGPAGVEAWLTRFVERDIGDGTRQLHDTARRVAAPLKLQREFEQLDAMIRALMARHT